MGVGNSQRSGFHGQIFENIRQHEVDFAIGPTLSSMTDFHFEPVLQEELCALIPFTHALARKRKVSMKDLDGLSIVMLNARAAMRQLVEEAARASNASLNVKYEVHQPQTLIAFAAAGLAIAIIPRIAVPVTQPMSFRVVAISDPPIVREMSIITARGQQLSPMAAELANEVRRSIRAAT